MKTQREAGCVKTEAGIRVRPPQAKEWLGLREVRQDTPQRTQREGGPATPPSLTSILQNCGTTHFCCFSHQFVVFCYDSCRNLVELTSTKRAPLHSWHTCLYLLTHFYTHVESQLRQFN